jgi:enoyl-CoA hydratase/carnithine racemase
MAEAEPVLWAIDHRGVVGVTLNRPRVHNVYNAALIDALVATFARLAAGAER